MIDDIVFTVGYTNAYQPFSFVCVEVKVPITEKNIQIAEYYRFSLQDISCKLTEIKLIIFKRIKSRFYISSIVS